MAWQPDPWDVKPIRRSGLGDMATLADQNPSPSIGMHVPYVLLYFKAWFAGGAGAADVTLNQKVRNDDTTWFDRPLRVLVDGGTGTNAFIDFRVQADELYRWGFDADTLIVPVWTNPDSGTMRWSWEAGVAPYPGGVQ